MKNVECPKCLGEGEVYDPINNTSITCNLCKGKKNLEEKLADLYDPIADELSNLKIEEEE
jgi:excinuclease UvrABC ATPase subunit